LLCAAALAGCAAGAISSVELDPTQTIVCDTSVTPNMCGVEWGKPVLLLVRGKGVCNPVLSHCGNGTDGAPFGLGQDFGQRPADQPLRLVCSYDRGWPGPKTVQVNSNGSDCVGAPTLKVNVLSTAHGPATSVFRLGFAPSRTAACGAPPSIGLPLRNHTKVSIKTNPDPNVRMNFGCPFGGCVYDADGEPNSSAPAGFAFPGLRKYSLVLVVGTQQVQGGTDMSFVTNQGGMLQVCVNDDLQNLADNSGAWGVFISIDESQAP
jgi:hypothetical protein